MKQVNKAGVYIKAPLKTATAKIATGYIAAKRTGTPKYYFIQIACLLLYKTLAG